MRSGKLNDQVILIIGGTSGIGLSGASALLEEGAKVVFTGKTAEAVATAATRLGPGATGVVADATDPDSADRAVTRTMEVHSRLDALYHVAGGSGRRFGDGPLAEISNEGWALTLQLNLSSVFYSNRAAVRQFLAQKTGGAILNIASVLATHPSPEHFATHAYATAKAGIIGLSQSAAARYAPEGIRINVIAPGLIETPMSERATKDPLIMDFVRRKQPLDGGRIGNSEDLDSAVVYFLSPASRFVTGQVLSIDGGWGVSEGPSHR